MQVIKSEKKDLWYLDQLSDKGFIVVFEPNHCLIYDAFSSIVLIEKRVNNIYLIDLHHASYNIHCFLINEGVFLGYATQSHAYRVYNKRLMTVEESMHVVFDETNPKLQDQVSKNADAKDLL